MKAILSLSFLMLVTGCGIAVSKGKPKPTQPCVAQRIEGGVKITCPTSEAIVYDGEAEVGPVGPAGDSCEVSNTGLIQCGNSAYQMPVPVDGIDGASCVVSPAGLVQCGDTTYQIPETTSCSVSGNGLVQCGTSEYQLPYTTPVDECNVVILRGPTE